MSNVVGFGGPKGAGKDTLAYAMAARSGAVVWGMSDPLEEALRAVNPWVPVQRPLFLGPGKGSMSVGLYRAATVLDLAGYSQAKKVPEIRRLLQVIGTDFVRDLVDEDAWVNMMRRRIRAHAKEHPGQDVYVTGIRFGNELDMIQSEGGVAIYVKRPGLARDLNSNHASERSLPESEFDFTLVNDGTLEDLDKSAAPLLARMSHPAATLRP